MPTTPSTAPATATAQRAPATAKHAPATAKHAPAAAKPAPATAATALKIAANPTGLLSYDTKTLSAKAGTVTMTMTNEAPLEHNLTIASGNTVLGATPTFKGGSKTLTLKLKPGTYTFYCTVPGHRAAGMEGTLTVS